MMYKFSKHSERFENDSISLVERRGKSEVNRERQDALVFKAYVLKTFSVLKTFPVLNTFTALKRKYSLY